MNLIPLAKPNISDRDILAVTKVLQSGMLVQGKEVLNFEERIAKYCGVKEAIMVSNGTASLHLSLIALGVGEGDEVIVPAFSYVATANVVELVGATPIFVDIELLTFNIDVTKIEGKITSKTKAIIPVHEFGLACDILEISKIAEKHSLFVIEDAACALGAIDNKKRSGSFGDTGSFSFHPRKAITSGEGGIITTNNVELANKIRVLRNHGISIINNEMEFIEAGFNYRLTDIQAALLNSQFDRFNEQLKNKEKIASFYKENITNSLITLPTVPQNKTHTWQTFHLLLNKTLNRDKIIKRLKDKSIATNYGAQCIPFQKYYINKYNLNCLNLFPNSMLAFNQGLAIPLYETLTLKERNYIVEQINKIEI